MTTSTKPSDSLFHLADVSRHAALRVVQVSSFSSSFGAMYEREA